MFDFTETPYAEDFAAELSDLIDEYVRRGLTFDWIVLLMKSAIEDMGESHD
ncbi:hypothetical protein ACQKOE_10050 [Novosphingobium sp. NPDC080210]|uniref:hypothetical protein n=1 Tax=Novosphingobium sp. NPDC080210 TaxID=3390596 RepID=UPI003D07D076